MPLSPAAGSSARPGQPGLVSRTILARIDPDRNVWRYYRVEVGPCLIGPWAVHRVWGRLGQRRSGFLVNLCASQVEAGALAERLVRRKLKRGYIIIEQELL